nr:MAG TPA: hypothetical protein [Caudoviricetes sp.]
MEELGNDKSYRSSKSYRAEDINDVNVAFTPLAYDVIMRIEVHNGDLYDRLLRILDRDELHAIIRDALMHPFLHLFTHPEFITSPNNVERFEVVLRNLEPYTRRLSYEVLKDNPTIRKGFFLFRGRRTRKIAYELMNELERHIWKASSGFFRDEYTEFEIWKMEKDNRIRKAFEPLAVDMLDYFKKKNAKLYKRLLRILTEEEAVAVIPDAIMHSTSCLFKSLGFNLLRSQADYCAFFFLHLDNYIRDYAFQLLGYHPTIRKGFTLFRALRTLNIASRLTSAMSASFRKCAKRKYVLPIIESITWVCEKTGATYPIFETYIDEDGSLGIY